MPESRVLVPINPRVDFILNHRNDLRDWSAIPFDIGFITAPLYDHRPGILQLAIVLAFVAGSFFWERAFRAWIESRIGVFRDGVLFPAKPFKLSFAREASIWGVLALMTAVMILLHRNSTHYEPDGWMERSVGAWICGAIVLCLRRLFDGTNLRERRRWNGVGAIILIAAYNFIGASPNSYAVLFVVVGSVYLVLALLDVGMLLHFARTPLSNEGA
jgi:hypothetical protein